MKHAGILDSDMHHSADALRAKGTAFAIATVVRTIDSTSVKPGAKALVLENGRITEGWIGGNCVRTAVANAAAEAILDGQPKLISLRPGEALEQEGVQAGDIFEGSKFVRNGCPSKGSMDIFVEPVLPKPELVILGDSPVAHALVELAGVFDFKICGQEKKPKSSKIPVGLRRFIVIASQGNGDIAHLSSALKSASDYVAFVGSKRKFVTLMEKLAAQGFEQNALEQVVVPAGLHIHAVTPTEIALSILAQIIQERRKGYRGKGETNV